MNKDKAVILKPGKEKAIKHRHHWIFSGAVESHPSFQDGSILPVYSSGNELLGSAYFNKKSGIIGRMVCFNDQLPTAAIKQRIDDAILMRQNLFNPEVTNGFRLINGEGDGLPGLIVDRYDKVLVIQVSTKGIDLLKPLIIDHLAEKLLPTTIYEKSLTPSRREEGLFDKQGFLTGEEVEETRFKENGFLFDISLPKSQKTGFFLDHREMRDWVRGVSKGKRVLNAFSYTGAFSVYALGGGAKFVHSVDISEDAIEMAKRNVLLNGFHIQKESFICEDVFQFLRERELKNYELVILDPPAFAKKQKDVIAACRGYKDINRLAFEKMPAHSMLLTSSCSYHVDEELFTKVVFQAAAEANRQVRIIGKHRLAADHPINIFHPEGDYLKSLMLYII